MTTPERRVRFRTHNDNDQPAAQVQISKPDKNVKAAPPKTFRPIRVDDVLWLLAFILTMWYFDVPCTIWFDPRIRWAYLWTSLALWLGFFAIGVFFIVYLGQTVDPDDWRKAYPRLFPLATSLYVLSCIVFCYAVWPVWSGWSLLIVFVCSVSSIIAVSLFP